MIPAAPVSLRLLHFTLSHRLSHLVSDFNFSARAHGHQNLDLVTIYDMEEEVKWRKV